MSLILVAAKVQFATMLQLKKIDTYQFHQYKVFQKREAEIVCVENL